MKAKQVIIILFFVSVVIVGILLALSQQQTGNSNNSITNKSVNNSNIAVECSEDIDCMVGGCSGQLCISRDKADSIITTCEWRDEYACYREDDCICKNNICQWAGNRAFTECLKALE